MNEHYYGVYRGTVTNDTPDEIGKIEVTIPAVLGDTRVKAYPCTPYAGPQVGFFMIPPAQAKVWIAFADGNLDEPIILGCFWGNAAEKPLTATSASIKLIETQQASVSIDDQQGSITLMHKVSQNQIVIDGTKIVITTGAGKIEVQGSTVKVNNGALEVT